MNIYCPGEEEPMKPADNPTNPSSVMSMSYIVVATKNSKPVRAFTGAPEPAR